MEILELLCKNLRQKSLKWNKYKIVIRVAELRKRGMITKL